MICLRKYYVLLLILLTNISLPFNNYMEVNIEYWIKKYTRYLNINNVYIGQMHPSKMLHVAQYPIFLSWNLWVAILLSWQVWWCRDTFNLSSPGHRQTDTRPSIILPASLLHRSADDQSVLSSVFTITEKAPTGAFTFKNLLRHYVKRVLTPL